MKNMLSLIFWSILFVMCIVGIFNPGLIFTLLLFIFVIIILSPVLTTVVCGLAQYKFFVYLMKKFSR